MGLEKKTISARVDGETAAWLEARASQEKRTLSSLCAILLAERLEMDAALTCAMKLTKTSSPAQAIDALLSLAGDA